MTSFSTDNEFDTEEGAITSRGNSKVTTETVIFQQNNNEIIDDKELNRIMGFSYFNTTKNKVVEDNFHGAAIGGASKHKKRLYRQYMNRKGGFNRPLQKMD